jgi:hypothetical protein
VIKAMAAAARRESDPVPRPSRFRGMAPDIDLPVHRQYADD